MPDIGIMELLVIGIVALIVVGPKDLPNMFRTVGRFTGRMRGMAKEFSRAMNDAADDAGVGNISRDLRNIANPKKMGMDAVNKAFEGIDPTKYPEGSDSRKLAEERAAESKAAREKAAKIAKQRQEETRAASRPAEPEPPAADNEATES